jgi:hypothetical protein
VAEWQGGSGALYIRVKKMFHGHIYKKKHEKLIFVNGPKNAGKNAQKVTKIPQNHLKYH